MNAIIAARPLNLSRRAALFGAAAGSLLLGLRTAPRAHAQANTPTAGSLNAFLAIGPDGTVTLQCPFAEGGQGIYTGMAQIVAEELDVPMSAMRVVQAPAGRAWRTMPMGPEPIRFTGGSYSTRSSYAAMRRMGASARAMLVAAAAARWGVPAAALTVEDGTVRHAASGRSASYGALAADAARLSPPAEPALKDPRAFQLIGTSAKRIDTAAKSDGSAVFGIDVRVPGMAQAAILHSPVPGSRPAVIDDAAAKAMPGVIGVHALPGAVGVVAETWWQAHRAAQALAVTWEAPAEAASVSSRTMLAAMQARLDEPGHAAERQGDVVAAMAGAARRIEAVYDAPFLAHAALEPLNCTAQVVGDRVTLWVGNQGPDFFAMVAAQVAGVPIENVTVNTPYLGGFFGRRFVYGPEQVGQAVLLAKATGRPVKVIWSREEDMKADQFRPLATAKLRAGLDAGGRLVALHTTAVGEGPLGRWLPHFQADPNIDGSVVEGLVAKPYRIGARQVDLVRHPLRYPIGFWRSVGHSMNDWFMESFIDEVAHAAGQDPFAYRLGMLAPETREAVLLRAVAELAGGWRGAPYEVAGSRRAMGLALSEAFGSLCAQIAEVSLTGDGVSVTRVWCAVDPGSIVNPTLVTRQMQSGIAYGLSAALYEEMTIENGVAQQTNFDSYRWLGPEAMPEVMVRIVESGAPMGGIGEPGTAPIAAAVSNGLFALTGTRIRSLPLAKHALRGA